MSDWTQAPQMGVDQDRAKKLQQGFTAPALHPIDALKSAWLAMTTSSDKKPQSDD